MTKKIRSYAFLGFLLFSVAARSESKEEDISQSLSYPELDVAPRASERVRIEAERERRESWIFNWSVELASVSTMVVGLMANGHPDRPESDSSVNNNRWASQAALGVGGTWAAISIYSALFYRPYLQTYRELGKGKSGGSVREQLTTERLAEEGLMSPARFGTVMKWTSAATCLAASLFVAGSSSSDPRVAALISGGLSLLPIFFPPHWETVYDQHQLYKKRIYGPVGSLGVGVGGTPALGVTWFWD